jgi:cobaltochelatase CobS
MKVMKICSLSKIYKSENDFVKLSIAPVVSRAILKNSGKPTIDGWGTVNVKRQILVDSGVHFNENAGTVDHLVVVVTDDSEESLISRYTFQGLLNNEGGKMITQSGTAENTGRIPDVDQVFPSIKFIRPDYGNDVLSYILADVPVLLVGPAGCGKTALVYDLGNECNKPVYRVNFDGGMTPESFMGSVRVRAVREDDRPVRQETYFQEGPVVQAAKTGAWLILDECDRAAPEYITALHALAENTQNPITLNDDGGRQVIPHPDFRIIATANTLGSSGDAGLGYYGSSPMNLSFKDRFAIFRVDYSEKAETEIIKTVFPEDGANAKKITDLFRLLRKSVTDGKMSGQVFSTRRLLAFLKALCLFKSFDKAFVYEISGRLDGGDKNLVDVIFSDVFGSLPGRG